MQICLKTTGRVANSVESDQMLQKFLKDWHLSYFDVSKFKEKIKFSFQWSSLSVEFNYKKSSNTQCFKNITVLNESLKIL